MKFTIIVLFNREDKNFNEENFIKVNNAKILILIF